MHYRLGRLCTARLVLEGALTLSRSERIVLKFQILILRGDVGVTGKPGIPSKFLGQQARMLSGKDQHLLPMRLGFATKFAEMVQNMGFSGLKQPEKRLVSRDFATSLAADVADQRR